MLESLNNINFANISNNKNIGIEVGFEIQEASWVKSPFKSITGRGSDRGIRTYAVKNAQPYRPRLKAQLSGSGVSGNTDFEANYDKLEILSQTIYPEVFGNALPSQIRAYDEIERIDFIKEACDSLANWMNEERDKRIVASLTNDFTNYLYTPTMSVATIRKAIFLARNGLKESNTKAFPIKPIRADMVSVGDVVVQNTSYMARKYLGMDLNVNLNGNLNITSENQTRVKNLTSATSKIYDGVKALNLGDRLIQKAQDNSGIFSALKRFANEKTNGFIGLNSDEAETMNALKNYAYSTARHMGGQLTNQKIKDAQEMTKFGFRSKEENTARLGENQGRLVQILEQDMNNLESLGGEVPKSVILELLKHKKRLEYIQKNQGKIKLKEYQEINPYSEFSPNDRN